MLEMEDSSQIVCAGEEVTGLDCQDKYPESIGCKFKNAITNLAYNLKHSNYLNIPGVLRERITLTQNQKAYLLGRQYSYEERQEFDSHFRNTIWFSYRKNIPGIGDDRGWGCMIRAVQMMLAEALKRSMQATSLQVLPHFKEKGKLSFTNICKTGTIKKRWTTATQVLSACCEILKAETWSRLCIINSPFCCLIVERLKLKLQSVKPGCTTLIVLHGKLGYNNIDKDLLPHLMQIMKMPYFNGLLGGVSGEAMYILGFKDSKVITLDPHYVQDYDQSDSTYFKQHARGLDFDKLSSCISITFLVSNCEESNDLVRRLFKLEEVYKQNRVLTLILSSEERAQLVEQEENEKEGESQSQRTRKVSLEDFELLQ